MQRLTLFIITMLFMTQSIAIKLPKLAPSGYNGMTLHEEKLLGKQFYQYMLSHAPLVRDPLALETLNDLAFRLVAASNRPDQHFLFFILNDPSINAFAGPDGYIGINSGLITFANTEGELASVLAHEIAHTTERHIAQHMEAANRGLLPTAAAVVAAIVTGNPALAVGAMGANAQAQVSFTRAQEREADAEGMKTLQRAGFNPGDMAAMFQQMSRANFDNTGQHIEFLLTHPLTENRIARAQNATTFNHHQADKPSLSFQLLRVRLMVLLSKDQKATQAYFHHKMVNKPKNLAYQYAYAMTLADNHDFTPAITILQQLAQQEPDEIYFPYTLAEVLAMAGHVPQSLQLLKQQLHDYPSSKPLIYQYANIAMTHKDYDIAAKFLERYYRELNTDMVYLNLYQHALGKSGQLAKAYQIRAKIFLHAGRRKAAIAQLQQALAQPRLDSVEKASIEAQIKRLSDTKS